MMNIKTITGAALVMAFSASAVQAAYTPTVTTTGNNFTMLHPGNGVTGGTNDVTFTWDGSMPRFWSLARSTGCLALPKMNTRALCCRLRRDRDMGAFFSK